ncbi:MAG: acetoacetate--CoA ligase [Bacteroidota bacterium]
MQAPLWTPSPEFQARTRIRHYLDWLQNRHALSFPDYEALWHWSTSERAAFWKSIWEYFEVQAHHPYEAVVSSDPMPDTEWFPGATLNYAEHVFRMETDERPAILYQSEAYPLEEMSWRELRAQVAAMAAFLTAVGVEAGDRVVAYLPNIPAATVGFLAACSLGAVWSSCSPDFGSQSVVERFQQIEPKVLLAVDGYHYGGKGHDKRGVVQEIAAHLRSLQASVLIPFLELDARPFLSGMKSWAEVMATPHGELSFLPVPFSHPIWVLYSSGTTGIPKAITHSQGGCLLEHLKYLAFHNDVHPGDRFFWFSTTGWMMWNFVQAALLVGATIVLYDGSPGYPNLERMWHLAAEAELDHFGTSAPFLVACMKAGLNPRELGSLSRLRSLSSTGAPLPPEAFRWVYDSIKEDLWLCSMSGGTDVCTAFVGGMPLAPVYEGQIQRRALGVPLFAWNERGEPIEGEVGEMVITKAMPSMPIYFWNDPDKARYQSSYFEHYAGVWRHGDWLKITPEGGLIIYGRSDATLNRQGVRIGTAEIYRAVHHLSAIKDSLIVNLELPDGQHYMPLFVQLQPGQALDETLIKAVRTHIRQTYSPRHVPDELIAVDQIPYTISGKKLEAPVKKILMGIPIEKAANPGAMRNPEALDFFVHFREEKGLFP